MWRPLQGSYLLLVERERVDAFVSHPEVPDVNLSSGISSDSEEVLVERVELAHTETGFCIFESKSEPLCSQVPDFEMGIVRR